MINKRDSFRIRKYIDVSWSLPEQQIEGKGKISNISLSGMAFETDRLFQPDHGMILSIRSVQVPSLPSKGKLVWFKKAGEAKSHYQCGIKFLKDGAFNPHWVKWMDDNIQKLADTGDNKILNHYLTSEGQE